ncbi:DEAD-box helicase Dbp80-like [Topomyia yanbarensis]|uniref:DEAD-box helicase Dbp80-like n=1 Tax=Topomyia yanbarensis TaxID=2498891 RepID=UPI00273C88AF|nr:DEAD-box helicase Dbp80-like [Topomyia yanbarensis]
MVTTQQQNTAIMGQQQIQHQDPRKGLSLSVIDLSIPKDKEPEPTADSPKQENAEKPSSSPPVEPAIKLLRPADASLLIKLIRKGLVESKLDLGVKDPSSPLYLVKTFEALHMNSELLQGVYAMGFNAPSKIQKTAHPTLLADPPQNIIAQSWSGTRKTTAFVLAMLNRVNPLKNYPQVICLSPPTYEREVMGFVQYIVTNPIMILLVREQESLDNTKHYYVKCRNQDEKYQAISNMYGVITVGQAIIFSHMMYRTVARKTADWLTGRMSQDGHSVAVLSGDLTVEQRLERTFCPGVTIVVNFDLPMD